MTTNETTARPTAEMSACVHGHHFPIIVGANLHDCRVHFDALGWGPGFRFYAVTPLTNQSRGRVGPVYVTERGKTLPDPKTRLRQHLNNAEQPLLWHTAVPCGLTCICSREDSERVA